jgi:hypothetical protein
MLPIKRVVLFKHGIGYFQRSGEVEGDQLIELGFKASQMNDVLKSLTALDYGGGNFAALSYDSEEPLERRLAELNMDIPEKGAISAFLDRLKGARVALPRGDKQLEGVVVGIEEVQRTENQSVVKDSHLAVLAEGGRLVRVPLLEVEELELKDDSVQRDLQSLLDIFFSGLRKDRKRLSIQALGSGGRKILLSYVIEAPVWKTSYRIVLPADQKEKPLLQGWALVDNTTEDDWEQVSLSLVAGLPISFIHDLYTPRYRQRPVVRVEEEAAVAPPVVEAGMMMDMDEMACAEPEEEFEDDIDMLRSEAPMRARKMMAPGAPPPQPSMARAAKESVQVHTRTQEVGDLFAYEITQPVDIGRSRSALVPILQTETDMERVALYNPEIRDKNPMTAFRIKNNTGLTLEGGPVTVFEGDNYVGEAMLDTMRQEDERLTPYSVELGITVKHEESHVRENYTRVVKSGTYIYKYYRQLRKMTYEFNSRLDRKVDAYLDHRFHYNVREDTPEPVEITDNFWRFKIELEPKKTTKFTVSEVSEQAESIEITGIAKKAIHQMVNEKLISEKIKAELEKIADKAEEIQDIEEEIAKKERAEQKIEKGQKRLRENLKALGNTSEEAKLRQKYVSSLGKEEERIEKLRSEVAALKEKLEREQDLLDEMVEKLDLRE